MKALFTFIFLCFLSLISFGQQIRIGVYRDHDIQRIVFAHDGTNYSVFADTSYVGELINEGYIEIQETTDKRLELFIGIVSQGIFDKISLIASEENASIELTPTIPTVKTRKYQDDFEITTGLKGLTLVNVVNFNNYLAGVVESEGGTGKEIEYYKVQALMSRTYALKYLSKHTKEGFNLCDRTHCQAYHYKLRFTPDIEKAVRATENVVMEDELGNLVDAYFHANCGGQTSEADYIWNNRVEYLNTFKDTFCVYTKQATWEKRIPKQQWADFLIKRYNYPISDSILGPLVFNFTQTERLAFYHHPILGIPLRDIRQEFKLKSTYFSNYLDGKEVLVRGRGYGHGVGLCQEGAMQMSKYKYNYLQIAMYYFPGIQIHNIAEDAFYAQRGNLFLCSPYRTED